MPDAGVTVEIEGLDKLIKKLEKLGQLSKVHSGIRAAGRMLKGLMTKYPPQTAANVPAGPGSSWYQRGKGSWYWRIRDNQKVPGKKKSERLETKWSTKYDKAKFELQTGTNVSYSKFVQGPKGTQAKALKKIGWKGIDVVSKEQTPRIQEMVYQAVKRAIESV